MNRSERRRATRQYRRFTDAVASLRSVAGGSYAALPDVPRGADQLRAVASSAYEAFRLRLLTKRQARLLGVVGSVLNDRERRNWA